MRHRRTRAWWSLPSDRPRRGLLVSQRLVAWPSPLSHPRGMHVFTAGDICHLLSFVVMFWKLHTSKSVAGISLKTQELYAIVFLARYLDLFWNFLSMYNVVMKIIFIISSMSIVYIIRFGVPHKDTYNAEDDAFPYLYLIVPAALLGVAINQDYSSPFEMCWAFSIYLEAVAILPQLFMLQKQGPPRHVEGFARTPYAQPARDLSALFRRLGESDVALHLPARHVPPLLPLQLGVPLRHGGQLHAADRVGLRHRADGAVPRLFLHVHQRQAGTHRRTHRAAGVGRCPARCYGRQVTGDRRPLFPLATYACGRLLPSLARVPCGVWKGLGGAEPRKMC